MSQLYTEQFPTEEVISKGLIEILSQRVPTRQIKMYTGVHGYDKFNEYFEDSLGLKRFYLGKKVIRIIKRLNFTIKTNPSGLKYKLIRK